MDKKLIVNSYYNSPLGEKIITMAEPDEIFSFDENTEYYRVDLIISEETLEFYLNLSNLLKDTAIEDLYEEDKPLTVKLIEAIKYTSVELNVLEYSGGEYFCEVVVHKNSNSFKLSCTIEECLSMSAFFKTSVSFSNKVLNKIGMIFKNGCRINRTPNLKVDTHINKLGKLKQELQKAIAKDDFELATEITKKIKEIENNQ